MRFSPWAVSPWAVAGLAAVAGVAAVMPLDLPLVNDWAFRIATLVMLAVSWNMMASAGMISLGHSAFWGLGSYAAVLAVTSGMPFFSLSFLPALLVGAAAGGLLALATGRLRGVFFAMATLAMSEGLRVVALMVPDVTGGAAGLYVPPAMRPAPILLDYAALGGACAAVALTVGLARTRMRHAMRAMRENEAAAEMIGINPLLYRTMVCCLAGAMAACGGALNVWHDAYLTPDIAFGLNFAILAQIATILGGVGTLAGPPVGAVMIVLLSEATRIWLGENQGYSLLIFGVVLVGCVLVMPHGVCGLGAREPRRASGHV